jgi:hypothetical protein
MEQVPTNSTPEPDNPDAVYWPAYRRLIFEVRRRSNSPSSSLAGAPVRLSVFHR